MQRLATYSYSALISMIVIFSSCNRNGPASLRLAAPPIDAIDATERAFDLFDSNGDGNLSKEELKSCPSLNHELSRYDTNANSVLSAEEIKQRIDSILESSSGLMSVTCSVVMNGRPLADAAVTFVPEPFLGDVLKPAHGKTDHNGGAELSLPSDDLPENYRELRVMPPGLYQVRVSHPKIQIADRFNTRTTLGCEVSAEATNPAFPLRFDVSK